MIADSDEVEVLFIDKGNMALYPEDIQKMLSKRLDTAFNFDRPYPDNITEAIKDKFREWDRFKIN